MSDGMYKIITCDRCGYELRIPEKEADEMTSRLPDDWGFAYGKPHGSDLCPKCFEEYKILVSNFMKEIKEMQTLRITEEEFDAMFANVLVGRAKTQNSNFISVYDGVSEAVRCAMCNNPNKSDRGCDGACSYDEKLYEKIMSAIDESRVDTSQTEVREVCDKDGNCENCWKQLHCRAKDTPQMKIKTGCSRCEAKKRCPDADSEVARWCNNYNKDIQTQRSE